MHIYKVNTTASYTIIYLTFIVCEFLYLLILFPIFIIIQYTNDSHYSFDINLYSKITTFAFLYSHIYSILYIIAYAHLHSSNKKIGIHLNIINIIVTILLLLITYFIGIQKLEPTIAISIICIIVSIILLNFIEKKKQYIQNNLDNNGNIPLILLSQQQNTQNNVNTDCDIRYHELKKVE